MLFRKVCWEDSACGYVCWLSCCHLLSMTCTLIARSMWPTWGPSGANRAQVGPMLAPWTLLSGNLKRLKVMSWTICSDYSEWYMIVATQRSLDRCRFTVSSFRESHLPNKTINRPRETLLWPIISMNYVAPRFKTGELNDNSPSVENHDRA